MTKLPKSVRNGIVAVLLLCALPAAYAGCLQIVGNVHTVEPDLVYRSAQLGPAALQKLIDAHHIRSILNLRGTHRDAAWYRDETLVAAGSGVEEIAIGISADEEPSPETLARIEAAVRDAPKPLLIHCKSGADRSGLASAIYEYAVAGRPAAVADGQLSFFYGHFPWLISRTGAMDEAFVDFVQRREASRAFAAGDSQP
ncbi:fused DSP-PTPase phosphatase/NAD kinase-like protein [Jiella sonneratiae]|uniref:Tyrosine-protein phosphatase n=1 Tax=Jiella sonneratiae TaxID=2816856 RepID=A0ABS3J3Q0_9HYPH|nr:tyrosine-protein phosphatase [Jiella sonneratiae]MBO0904287.1 tyrosine-protein phosphatase [Jiella sonneratiae]